MVSLMRVPAKLKPRLTHVTFTKIQNYRMATVLTPWSRSCVREAVKPNNEKQEDKQRFTT